MQITEPKLAFLTWTFSLDGTSGYLEELPCYTITIGFCSALGSPSSGTGEWNDSDFQGFTS